MSDICKFDVIFNETIYQFIARLLLVVPWSRLQQNHNFAIP